MLTVQAVSVLLSCGELMNTRPFAPIPPCTPLIFLFYQHDLIPPTTQLPVHVRAVTPIVVPSPCPISSLHQTYQKTMAATGINKNANEVEVIVEDDDEDST